MIDEGKYIARAKPECEHGRTPNTGTAFIRLQFEIISEGEFRGHQIHSDLWLSEKTAERTMDSLEHCGWDGVSLANPQGIGTKDCQIVIEHEVSDRDGKTYPRVKWVNALSSGAKLKDEVKLDQAALRDLDREFKASLLERRQRSGSGPAGPTPRPSNHRPPVARNESTPRRGREPGDDDIPF